jgi:hypothetical protein
MLAFNARRACGSGGSPRTRRSSRRNCKSAIKILAGQDATPSWKSYCSLTATANAAGPGINLVTEPITIIGHLETP